MPAYASNYLGASPKPNGVSVRDDYRNTTVPLCVSWCRAGVGGAVFNDRGEVLVSVDDSLERAAVAGG
jgi:hypothetical protein